MNHNLNIHLGIQVVPMAERSNSFPAIDRIIEHISKKNFLFEVTPFETVVECTFPEALNIIKETFEIMNANFKGEYLINTRFHIHPSQSISWDEKVKSHGS